MQILIFLLLLPLLTLSYFQCAVNECYKLDEAPVRSPRAASNDSMAAEIKKTLQEADKSVKDLAGATQNFADVFLKMEPTKLLKIFKSFSFAAGIVTAFLPDPQDEATKKILNAIDDGFQKMESKIHSQTDEIKAYLDENDYKTAVLVPLSTASQAMNIYRKKPTAANRKQFIRRYCEAFLTTALTHIMDKAEIMQRNVVKATRYDSKAFSIIRSTISKHFYQVFTIEYFVLGLKYKKNAEERKRLDFKFQRELKNLKSISQQVYDHYMANYFPGVLKEDVVEKIIDKGGMMCEMSKKIIETLTSMFPWNKYAVAITELTQGLTDFAYYPIAGRGMKVDYKDKRVVIFISSKHAKENKAAFEAEGALDLITKETKKINTMLAFTLLNYARNGNRSIQQAVFRTQNCMDFSNANVGTAWLIKMPYPTPFLGPFHRYYMMVIF